MRMILKYTLTIGFILIPAICFSQDIIPTIAREPMVTEQEASILEQVSILSRKDLKLAQNYLLGKIDKTASPAMDFAMGNVYFQMGKIQEAENAYRTALQKMPAFDRARANLTRVLLQQDKVTEARQQLEQLLLTGKQSASVMLLTGYVYLLDDKPVAAESAYRQALVSTPDDSNAYLGLAKALLGQERFQEAARLLETVLQDYPERGELWANLANARLALEQYDRAIVALETARRLGVASPQALATLGDLYLNREQYTESVQMYALAFDIEEPSIDRLLRAIEGFLQVGQFQQARKLVTQAQQLITEGKMTQHQQNQLQWLEAKQYQLAGDNTAAQKAYLNLLQRDPLNGKALLALGDLYLAKRSFEQALVYYGRAGRISLVQVEALTKQANVEVERENYTQAIDLLLDAQAIAPRESIAHFIEQLRYLRRK